MYHNYIIVIQMLDMVYNVTFPPSDLYIYISKAVNVTVCMYPV